MKRYIHMMPPSPYRVRAALDSAIGDAGIVSASLHSCYPGETNEIAERRPASWDPSRGRITEPIEFKEASGHAPDPWIALRCACGAIVLCVRLRVDYAIHTGSDVKVVVT